MADNLLDELPPSRPHLVLVVSEGANPWRLGEALHSHATNEAAANYPTLAKAGTSGVELVNVYSPPSGTPARSALLTGMYATSTGTQVKL